MTTATPTQDATQEGEADKATSQDAADESGIGAPDEERDQTEVSSPQPQPKKVDEDGFEDVWDTKLAP